MIPSKDVNRQREVHKQLIAKLDGLPILQWNSVLIISQSILLTE